MRSQAGQSLIPIRRPIHPVTLLFEEKAIQVNKTPTKKYFRITNGKFSFVNFFDKDILTDNRI